jgi:hypothetical protein
MDPGNCCTCSSYTHEVIERILKMKFFYTAEVPRFECLPKTKVAGKDGNIGLYTLLMNIPEYTKLTSKAGICPFLCRPNFLVVG